MIKLSERLKLIADQVEPGERVADIGTDHGYIPIYLKENKISDIAIMADISEGSLAKAKENALEGDFRLGSGISVLEPAEVDCVIIAGMGGLLITEILGADISLSRSFKKYVLQARNRVGELRKWLIGNDFSIEKNLLVREGKAICEIIVAKPKVLDYPISDVKIVLGPRKRYGHRKDALDRAESILWEVPKEYSNSELGLEFINKRLKIEKTILSGMDGNLEEYPLQERRVEYLNNLIK